MGRCFHCGAEVEIEGKVARGDTCPACHSSLHCCRNCRFYSESAHNKCEDPAAEWVSDREAGNFCEYFEFQKSGTAGLGGGKKDEARKKFDDLFKK